MMEKKETAKKRRRRTAVALVAALIVSALMSVTGFAAADAGLSAEGSAAGKDTDPGVYSVTVDPQEGADADELAAADVVLDIYPVAYADWSGDSDAVEFDWDNAPAAFNGVADDFQDLSDKALAGSLTSSDINGFTQDLAKAVLGDGTAAPIAADLHGTLGSKTELEEKGLYLIIARGSKDTDYVVPVETAGADTPIVTVATGTTQQFVFAPMLVSVPNRGQAALDSDEFNVGETESVYTVTAGNTANAGAWVYDVSLVAKAGVELTEEIGRVRVVKTLVNYEHLEGRNDKATFVFRIEAEQNGEVIYTNYASLVFEGASTQTSSWINNVPCGDDVTVTITEVYAGGDYTIASGSSASVEVQFEQVTTDAFTGLQGEAAFTNVHDGGWKGGGSATNSFFTATDQAGIRWDARKYLADDDQQRAADLADNDY